MLFKKVSEGIFLNLVGICLGFILSKLIIDRYGYELYGEYSFYISLIALVTPIVVFGTPVYFQRRKERNRFRGNFTKLIKLFLLIKHHN